MTPEFVTEIGQRVIETMLLLAAPALLFSLAAGLLVSLFQAVTQINESTLTFLPKVLGVALAFVLFLPWMLSLIVGFTTNLIAEIPLHLH